MRSARRSEAKWFRGWFKYLWICWGNALHSTDILGLLPNSAQMACARNPVLCAEIGLTPKPLPKPMVPPIPLPIPKNPTKDENCDNNGNCATTYPNLKKCDVLRGLGYIYSSHSAAKSAKGWGLFNRMVKEHQPILDLVLGMEHILILEKMV